MAGDRERWESGGAIRGSEQWYLHIPVIGSLIRQARAGALNDLYGTVIEQSDSQIMARRGQEVRVRHQKSIVEARSLGVSETKINEIIAAAKKAKHY